MGDFSMNEATFASVVGQYRNKPFFVGMDGADLEDIFSLVADLLEAECDAVKVREPYARNTIERLESARREVFMVSLDVGDAFEEVFGND